MGFLRRPQNLKKILIALLTTASCSVRETAYLSKSWRRFFKTNVVKLYYTNFTTPPSDLKTFQWLCVIWYNVLNLFLIEQFYVICKKVFKRHLERNNIVIMKNESFWYEIVGGWKWECSFENNFISNSMRIAMNSWNTIVGVISAIVDTFSIQWRAKNQEKVVTSFMDGTLDVFKF